jgi:hypothetical protein
MTKTLNNCDKCNYAGEAIVCPNCTSDAITQFSTYLKEQQAKSCAGRIEESLKDLNEELNSSMNNPDYDDYFNDSVLSIDTYKVTKLCLSYGGPSSYLEVTTNSHGEIIEVLYRFSDWYDTATLKVEEGTPAYEFIVQTLESLES